MKQVRLSKEFSLTVMCIKIRAIGEEVNRHFKGIGTDDILIKPLAV